MKRSRKRLLLFVSIILINVPLLAQTDKEKAHSLGVEAVESMDKGLLDESIALLEKAQKLDPLNYAYPYEQALAYYLKSDFSKTIHILEKLEKHEDVNARLYQLLGNAYDLTGKEKKALKAYRNGLKRFPNSGLLYFEIGVIDYNKRRLEDALVSFEKGIELDPLFPSNYFAASAIFFASNEEVWGMIYGEIFMNLERGTERTEIMSKLLYDTYESEIKIIGDSIHSVSFSESVVVKIKNAQDLLNNRLPFGVMVYEPTLLLAMQSVNQLNLSSLDLIRRNFIDIYYGKQYDITYPNLLFAYQKRVKDAGHMEAYNYWILMKGDEYSFGEWYEQNTEKWEAFMLWFSENPLLITAKQSFYRDMY